MPEIHKLKGFDIPCRAVSAIKKAKLIFIFKLIFLNFFKLVVPELELWSPKRQYAMPITRLSWLPVANKTNNDFLQCIKCMLTRPNLITNACPRY